MLARARISKLSPILLCLSILLLSVAASPKTTRAQQSSPPSTNRLVLDSSLASGMVLLWIGPDFFKNDLAADPCRWCDCSQGSWDPPSMDRWAHDSLDNSSHKAWATASDISVFGVMPLTLASIGYLEHREFNSSYARDMLVFAQSVAAAGMVNQVVKYSVGRKRPYAHTQSTPFSEDPDQNLSFYSGHTTAAFAQVVGMATLLYKNDSAYAPWVLGIGLPVAAFTGIMRIAADKHYLTDVLVGAAVGSLVSWAWVYTMY